MRSDRFDGRPTKEFIRLAKTDKKTQDKLIKAVISMFKANGIEIK